MDLNNLNQVATEVYEELQPIVKRMKFNIFKLVYNELFENVGGVIETLNDFTEYVFPKFIETMDKYIDDGINKISKELNIENIDKFSSIDELNVYIESLREQNPVDTDDQYNIQEIILNSCYSFAFNIYYEYREIFNEHGLVLSDVATNKLEQFLTRSELEELQDQITESPFFLDQPKEQIDFFIDFLTRTIKEAEENDIEIGLEDTFRFSEELFCNEHQLLDASLSRYMNFRLYFKLYKTVFELESV